MMRDTFLTFGAPHLGNEEISEVADCLRSGWLGTGPRVARFERDFAAYKGVPPETVAAVNSCTAALHVSMIAAGLQAGDEVITSPLTFCATINAILHAGATPVLADVDPATMNIAPEQVARLVTERTKAILPVHFAGRPCDMQGLAAIANANGLLIIEDCAHALETELDGIRAGTWGEFGCFSFYVTKNVTTGEGGMVVARDTKAIERVKRLSLHGMSKDAWHRFSDTGYKHYYVHESGFKYNMMDLQAAIGIHQLERVERNWERRRAIWQRYDDALAGLDVVLPPPPALGMRHACHLYTILVGGNADPPTRDEFMDRMTRNRIGVGVHYLSIPEHPYYHERFGWRPEQWPAAMHIGRHTVSLPLSPALNDQDVEDVIESVTASLPA